MSRIVWLVLEIVAGVLFAGVLVGGAVGAATAGGYATAPWMMWAGLAVSIALTVAVGESMRRRARHKA